MSEEVKRRKLRLLSGLAATAVAAACGGQSPESADLIEQPPTAENVMAPQSEGASAFFGDPVSDDLAYRTQLGLMRGHLLVGVTLYRFGALDHARTHMKHPADELYAGLAPAFAARGGGFAAELEALALAVEGDAPSEDVEAAYVAVVAAIADAESRIDAQAFGAAEFLKLAANLLRVAGEEYAIGVVDGSLENAHEYQDAYGFTQIARRIAEDASVADDPLAFEARERVLAHIDKLTDLWPEILPPSALGGDAAQIYAAAARIEIIAFNLETPGDAG